MVVIYVIRVIENLLEKYPKTSIITTIDLLSYQRNKNIMIDVLDAIQCDQSDLSDELTYIHQDIELGVYAE
jgi:hypothetical protein